MDWYNYSKNNLARIRVRHVLTLQCKMTTSRNICLDSGFQRLSHHDTMENDTVRMAHKGGSEKRLPVGDPWEVCGNLRSHLPFLWVETLCIICQPPGIVRSLVSVFKDIGTKTHTTVFLR